MNIRTYHPSDLDALTELTIATFGPYYEDHFRHQVGETVFRHQHGRWADDYRAEVPALHDPPAGKYVAVAEASDGTIAGYVAWSIGPAHRHGGLGPLVGAQAHRRHHRRSALPARL